LGIPEHEDKNVQREITKILNSIYENNFRFGKFDTFFDESGNRFGLSG